MESWQRSPVAAVATAPGEAGICVVRASGIAVFSLLEPWIESSGYPLTERLHGTFFHGRLCSPRNGRVVDQVIVLVFRAPHSYTGEDTVEIQGHGGSTNSRRILDAVLDSGMDPAPPGEFTRRAFLNGKMDLCQAEAVLDLIQSRTERAAKLASLQLDGCLSSLIKEIYDEICQLSATIEAQLDLEETNVDSVEAVMCRRHIGRMIHALCQLLKSAAVGNVLREGCTIVISGPPNVGKSTLMNALLGMSRAIVSDQPGTTRDTVDGWCSVDGYPLHLIDTAGLRSEALCEIEIEGMQRTRRAHHEAALNLWVTDGSRVMTAAEWDDFHQIPPPKLFIRNKSDRLACSEPGLHGISFLSCSARSGDGVDSIKQQIVHHIARDTDPRLKVAISARHQSILRRVVRHLLQARRQSWSSVPEWTLVACDVRAAADILGSFLGRNCGEDVLDAVFNRFCVGK